jgi:hypothetical protein
MDGEVVDSGEIWRRRGHEEKWRLCLIGITRYIHFASDVPL